MRWLLRLIFGLVLLVALAGLLFIMIPTETIARIAAERFSASTGRELTIRGEVSATLWPVIGISAEDVSLGNPDWSEGDNLMTASRVYVGIDPTTIFSDNIEIRSVELVAPVIVLEQGADGRANWSFGESSGEAGLSISVDSVRLSGADITYKRAGADPVVISDGDATLDLANGGLAARIDAGYSGQRISGTIDVADLSALGAGPARVVADLSVGDSKLLFDGPVDVSAGAITGALRLDILDRGAVFGLVGLDPPDLPIGLGRNRIGVISTVTVDGNNIRFGDLQLNLDQNHFTGVAELLLAARPKITADLSAAVFEMAAGGGGAGGPDWSDAPLPTAALQSFDADVDLDVGTAAVGGMQIGSSAFRIRLRNGEMSAEIPALGLFDGQASGSAQASFGQQVAFQADLTGSELSTARAGAQFLGSDRLASRASGTISVAGRGASVKAIMSSLSGSGTLALAEGELKGVDLPGLMKSLDPTLNGGASRTVFESASATFTILDGVLQNPDLSVIAPLLLGAGEGTVGIGPRTLDYTFVARIPESFIAPEVSLPIRITGTWANPKINLNLEEILESRLGVDLTEIGQEASADIRKKLADEFGIEIAPGQDIREALTESLEKRAIDQLTGGLFGGKAGAPLGDGPVPVTRDEMPTDEAASDPAPVADDTAPPESEPVADETPPEAETTEPVAEGNGLVVAPKSSLIPRPRPGTVLSDVPAPEPVAAEETAAETPLQERAAEPESEPAPGGEAEQIEQEPAPEPEPAPEQIEPPPEPDTTTEAEPEPVPDDAAPADPAPDALPACPEYPEADALPCLLEDGTVLTAEQP